MRASPRSDSSLWSPPRLRGLMSTSGPIGPLYSSRRDQDICTPPNTDRIALDRGAHLLIIAHIRPDAQRRASGVLDLQFRQVQFGLAACQQAYARTFRRKAYGQTLADTAARAGNQDYLVLQELGRWQTLILHARIEYSSFYCAAPLHLHVDAVIAGFGKSIGKVETSPAGPPSWNGPCPAYRTCRPYPP